MILAIHLILANNRVLVEIMMLISISNILLLPQPHSIQHLSLIHPVIAHVLPLNFSVVSALNIFVMLKCYHAVMLPSVMSAFVRRCRWRANALSVLILILERMI